MGRRPPRLPVWNWTRSGTGNTRSRGSRCTFGAGYHEVDEASAAVAAAALVAATVDGDVSAVPPKLRDLLEGLAPTSATRALAVEALGAVLGSSSELSSLWSHDPAWRKAIEALAGRAGPGGWHFPNTATVRPISIYDA